MNKVSKQINYFDKQYQLMMGLKYLSCLNQTPRPIQAFTLPICAETSYFKSAPITYSYPLPPHNNIFFPIQNDDSSLNPKFFSQMTFSFSFPSNQLEEKTTKTTDSFSQSILPNKTNTQSFQELHQSSQFLHSKTVRNTIIINNEEEMKENSNLSIKHHHDSPISRSGSKKLFSTHLLKLPIEQKLADQVYKCGHFGCDLSYKTMKQKISHHSKMDVKCQKDTTKVMKMIAKAKKIIRLLIKHKKIAKENEEFRKKYETIMKYHSLKEYAQMICGLKFKDK